jgi:DNA-binding NarL/FixJ family response regulator
MENVIRIAVADDHQLMREAIATLLGGVSDIEVVSTACSGEEAVNIANTECPDVFLMDIIMNGMTGIEATRWIKEQNPGVKVILVSAEVSKDHISDGIKMGIDGYLPKDTNKEELVEAIRTVVKGKKYFSPQVTSLVFTDFYLKETGGKGLPSNKKKDLTKREEEVLERIAAGNNLKQIAEELFISVKTVETHKQNIKDKLGLTNTAQLVRYAIDHKMIAL